MHPRPTLRAFFALLLMAPAIPKIDQLGDNLQNLFDVILESPFECHADVVELRIQSLQPRKRLHGG